MGKSTKRRLLKAAGIVLGSLAGLVLLMVLAVNVFLSESVLRSVVEKYAPEFVDGDLSYGKMDVKVFTTFPCLEVELSGMSLTYPSDLFEQAGKRTGRGDSESQLLDAGRGEDVDTLFSLGGLSLRMDYLDLLRGRFDVPRLILSDPRFFAHSYSDSCANWHVVKMLAEEDGEPEEPSSESEGDVLELPFVRLGEVTVQGSCRLVYTAPADDTFLDLSFRDISVAGGTSGRGFDQIIRNSCLNLSTSALKASLLSDSDAMSFGADSFSLSLKERRLLSSASTRLCYESVEDGRYDVPLDYDLSVSLPEGGGEEGVLARIESMRMNVLGLPTTVRGSLSWIPDSLWMDVRADVKNSSLSSVLDLYAKNFLDDPAILRPAAASASAWMTAKGSMYGDTYPEFDAGFSDLDFKYAEVDLEADGAMWDILGDDPAVTFKGDLDADLAEVTKLLPSDLGMSASGFLCVRADVRRMRMSQMDLNNFSKAALDLSADGRALDVKMDSDRYDIDTLTLKVNTSSSTGKLVANVYAGKVHALMDDMDMTLEGGRAVMSNGEEPAFSEIHPLEAGVSFERFDMSMGHDKMTAAGGSVNLSIVPRDTTARPGRRFKGGFRRPQTRGQDDFADSDIDLSVDADIAQLLKEWSFSGDMKLRNATYFTPSYLLNNRLTGTDISFTDNEVKVYNMGVSSGLSKFTLDGKVTGLRRAMMGKGRLRATLNVDADRINLNQMMAALDAGAKYERKLGLVSDDPQETSVEEVADSTSAGAYSSLLIVPANVVLDLNVDARQVDYSTLSISSLKGHVLARDRCAQMTDTRIITNMGEMSFDGFYYTKSTENIAAGFNLSLLDVSAEQAIALIPEVDEVLPMLKSFGGNMNLEMTATTMLDTTMTPILNTMNGVFKVSGSDLVLRDLGDLRSMARLLMFRDTRKGSIKKLNIYGVLNDSSLEVFPFLLKVDRYSLGLSGIQNFDQTFNYHASLIRSPLILKLGVDLFGDFDNFDYKLRGAKYRTERMPAYDERVDDYQARLVYLIRNIHEVGVEQAFLESRNSNWLNEAQRTTLEEGIVSNEETTEAEKKMFSALMNGGFTSPENPRVTLLDISKLPVPEHGLIVLNVR